MHVTIRLFARLRELAGHSELTRELPDDATVRSAWAALAREFPAAGRVRTLALGRRERGLRALHHRRCGTATRSRSCRRCRGEN